MCQAKRALLFWKSGTKQVPSGPAGYFSKTNWDDCMQRVNDQDVYVKKVTSLLKFVEKLQEKQWTKIIDGASALGKPRKVEADIIMIDSSDYEIEDGDEDLEPEPELVDRDEDLE
jgi:hypothetical protein